MHGIENLVGMASAIAALFSLHDADGTPHLVVAGPGGSHFRIDRSDLLGPAANWQMMTNFTVIGSMSQVRDTLGRLLYPLLSGRPDALRRLPY